MKTLAVICAAIAFCVSLQGCALTVPSHDVANWRAKDSYLVSYDYTGASATSLNSCMNDTVPATMKCSGHGTCHNWYTTYDNLLSFCECETNFADPECKTERKSHMVAFFLSVFFGIFGADHFYLGFAWPYGIVKLFTLGGAGFWWLFDIVRIGAAPPLTNGVFRCASDIPKWASNLLVISLMGLVGFALSVYSIYRHRLHKAREVMILKAEEEIASREDWRVDGPEQPFFHGKGFSFRSMMSPKSMFRGSLNPFESRRISNHRDT